MQEYFEIGQIVNTFGVKGFVKVKHFTDDLERFEELKNVYVEKKKELILYEIENVKFSKNMVILKLIVDLKKSFLIKVNFFMPTNYLLIR